MGRARARPRTSRRSLLLLPVLGAVVIAAVLYQGPPIVREVWSHVGVLRVESHADVIRAAAAESGVDPCLLAGIMYVESRGRPEAVSGKGALGLFQLMTSAAGDSARRLKLPEPAREDLLSDPLLNARLAASHLAWLQRHEGPDPERVLVAYNAGRGRLAGWIREAGSFEAWREGRERAGGQGTLAYARQVLGMCRRFRERAAISPPPQARGSAGGEATTGLPL